MHPEQPDVRTQLNALIPDEADRAALWKTAWDAYYAQYNAFRDANPGWQAFFSAHHSSALDAALEALLPQIIARGIAEGRRQVDEAARAAYYDGIGEGHAQATEGWERRWNVDEPTEGLLWGEAGTANETSARTALKQSRPDSRLVSRLVGLWEPAAEQPEPEEGRNA